MQVHTFFGRYKRPRERIRRPPASLRTSAPFQNAVHPLARCFLSPRSCLRPRPFRHLLAPTSPCSRPLLFPLLTSTTRSGSHTACWRFTLSPNDVVWRRPSIKLITPSGAIPNPILRVLHNIQAPIFKLVTLFKRPLAESQEILVLQAAVRRAQTTSGPSRTH